MFSKSGDYTYFADAIREPHVTFSENSKMRGTQSFRQGRRHTRKRKNAGAPPPKGRWDQAFHPLGRNKRTVWSIPFKVPWCSFRGFPRKSWWRRILASTQPGDVELDRSAAVEPRGGRQSSVENSLASSSIEARWHKSGSTWQRRSCFARTAKRLTIRSSRTFRSTNNMAGKSLPCCWLATQVGLTQAIGSDDNTSRTHGKR